MRTLGEIITDILKDKSAENMSNITPQEAVERRVARQNDKEGSLHLNDGILCDKCRNKGIILVAKQYDNLWQDVQRECECMKIRRNIRNLKNSGLENVVKECRFENFKVEKPFQESMLNKAKGFLANSKGQWFALLGASGSGKTMLCSAVAIELLRQGKELKYMLWKDDSRKIKNDNFDGNGSLIEYYKSVDILYIDDLFKTGKGSGEAQKPTAGDINIAFEILNNRCVRKKITIISSENTIDELFDIDEAIAGRIKQMCGEYCLSISKGEGKNYRKRDSK